MQVTLEIPDAYAADLTAAGQDPARAALEALAIEGYRTGRLNEYRMRLMLGFETRFGLWDFLGERNVERYYPEELVHMDIAVSEELANRRLEKNKAA